MIRAKQREMGEKGAAVLAMSLFRLFHPFLTALTESGGLVVVVQPEGGRGERDVQLDQCEGHMAKHVSERRGRVFVCVCAAESQVS